MFYLKFGLHVLSSQLVSEADIKLSLRAYAILRSVSAEHESIPPENGTEVEDLCRRMQEPTIDHLHNLRGYSTDTILAIVRAIKSALTTLQSSTGRYKDEDAVEACKYYCSVYPLCDLF